MKYKRTRFTTLPKFTAIAGQCLGYKVFRGFAPLKDLAAVSEADIFDQRKNPTGTQRNLNRQHARKAYEYVTSETEAFYPEIILNIRDKSYVKFEPFKEDGQSKCGTLEFVKHPNESDSIVVSRLDGNHRLWFVDGHEKGMDPVDRPVSFCILMLEDLNDELALFRAINDNQMGMNTSHLQNITARLLGKKALKATDPALYIAQRLQEDKTSPFHKRIHQGGVLVRGATLSGLTTANLKNAIKDMLTRSAKLTQFPDADVQFEVIKNYWLAVRKWLPDAWKRPNNYTIFRGVGILAITYLGIEIIDRCLLQGKFEPDDMLAYLRQLPSSDVFLANAPIPYAGRAGAKKMASDLIADLEEEGEVSLKKLQKMILGEK